MPKRCEKYNKKSQVCIQIKQRPLAEKKSYFNDSINVRYKIYS